MKKIYILFMLIGFISKAQIINISDQNFKMKLLSANVNNQVAGTGGYSFYPANYISIDANNNGEIEQSEALLVTVLDVAGANIYDLSGIEFFTNLRSLKCNNNHLTSISFPSLIRLEYLHCFANNLITLNLTSLIALKVLFCSNNQL